MLELVRNLIVNEVHAIQISSTTTSTGDFVPYLITQFYGSFWNPFTAWAIFGIVIAIVVMVVRRLRGQGRRPG